MTKLAFVFLNEGGGQIVRIALPDANQQAFSDVKLEHFLQADFDHVVAVLAGEDVSTWSIELPILADNKLLQILPAQLEDLRAIGSGDDHYALLSKNEDGTRLVACVSANVMDCAYATLARSGIKPDFLIPDYLLLPHTDGGALAKAISGHDRHLVRLSDGSGFSVNSLLINELKLFIKPKYIDIFTLSIDAFNDLNLLQGRYKRSLSIMAYGSLLRRAGVLACAVLILWAGAVFVGAHRDETEAKELRKETELLFKTAFPEITRIVNMEAQARRIVTQQGASDGGSFLKISEEVFAATSNSESAVVEGLRFNEEQNSFFFTISFGVFAESDNFLSKLRLSGLMVTEGGSRQEDGRIITDIAIEVMP